MAKNPILINREKVDIKKDVVSILTSFFGEDIGNTIEKEYESDNPKELLEVAELMMTKLVGPDNAKKQLKEVYLKVGESA